MTKEQMVTQVIDGVIKQFEDKTPSMITEKTKSQLFTIYSKYNKADLHRKLNDLYENGYV